MLLDIVVIFRFSFYHYYFTTWTLKYIIVSSR